MLQFTTMKLPDFSFEEPLWLSDGEKPIMVAGADEVGRGALAGPVTAACIIFPNLKFKIPESIIINDSKKLHPKQRETSALWIKKYALTWSIGWANVHEINRYGIVKATNKAYRRALTNCPLKIDHLLVDAFYIPHTKGLPKYKQSPIIKGDCKSLSIAAASIIAKVARDNFMRDLSKIPTYHAYKWSHNKGYGTRDHQEAIKRFGPTKLHRTSFLLNLS